MNPPVPDNATLQAAAQWFARLSAAPNDARMQARLGKWLDEDERHRLAWGYVERINERFGRLHQDADQAGQVLGSLRHARRSRRQVLGSLGALGGGLLFAWSSWQRGWIDAPRAWLAGYRTGLGEIRNERLSDGSQLWLNGSTALDVEFDARQRLLRLYGGELLIETGTDPRPLRVQTRSGWLQPMGTRFSVQEHGPRTELHVFAGAVQVTCADSGQQTLVRADQALAFDAHRAGPLFAAQPLREHWSQGLLSTEDMPLGQVIDILRGYRRGHLGIDPRLNDLRVFGTYPLNDSDRALAMLEKSLPIRVVHTLPWWVSIEQR